MARDAGQGRDVFSGMLTRLLHPTWRSQSRWEQAFKDPAGDISIPPGDGSRGWNRLSVTQLDTLYSIRPGDADQDGSRPSRTQLEMSPSHLETLAKVGDRPSPSKMEMLVEVRTHLLRSRSSWRCQLRWQQTFNDPARDMSTPSHPETPAEVETGLQGPSWRHRLKWEQAFSIPKMLVEVRMSSQTQAPAETLAELGTSPQHPSWRPQPTCE